MNIEEEENVKIGKKIWTHSKFSLGFMLKSVFLSLVRKQNRLLNMTKSSPFKNCPICSRVSELTRSCNGVFCFILLNYEGSRIGRSTENSNPVMTLSADGAKG